MSNQHLKIALIGCTVNPRAGGMGRALYDHAVALAEAGQEVTMYTLDPGSPTESGSGMTKEESPVLDDRITVGALRRFFSIGKAAWGARFDPPLDAYDVVHLHLPFFGVAERVARWRRSVIPGSRSETRDPVGNRWIPDSPSGFRDDKRRLLATYHMDAIGTGLRRIYFNWWYRHRFKKVLDACNAIAVTSRAYARDSWLARAGIDVEKCEEILLRADTDVFCPERAQRVEGPSDDALRLCSGHNYLLFVGALDRAHYFKGLSILLRAFKSVLDPGSAATPRSGMTKDGSSLGTTEEKTASGMTEEPRLVVVGAGELLEDYKKEAVQLGISDRVTFTGGVTDEELAAWYAGARALVLPSTDRSEAFGIVLIEAMACGTPVIASDLPGVREVVERVLGGVLVPFGIASSPGAPRNDKRGGGPRNDNLIVALQQMWQHPWTDDERAALAARAVSVYGRATLADQLLEWYRGIITT